MYVYIIYIYTCVLQVNFELSVAAAMCGMIKWEAAFEPGYSKIDIGPDGLSLLPAELSRMPWIVTAKTNSEFSCKAGLSQGKFEPHVCIWMVNWNINKHFGRFVLHSDPLKCPSVSPQIPSKRSLSSLVALYLGGSWCGMAMGDGRGGSSAGVWALPRWLFRWLGWPRPARSGASCWGWEMAPTAEL